MSSVADEQHTATDEDTARRTPPRRIELIRSRLLIGLAIVALTSLAAGCSYYAELNRVRQPVGGRFDCPTSRGCPVPPPRPPQPVRCTDRCAEPTYQYRSTDYYRPAPTSRW